MADFYSSYVQPPNGGHSYRIRLRINVSSQSIENNTTTVSWSLVIQKSASGNGFYGWGSAGRSVVLNGSTRLSGNTNEPDSAWTGTSVWTLGSGTYTFSHEADGTKTISVSAAYTRSPSGWAPGTMSLSSSMSIPRIPRPPLAPTISSLTATSSSSAEIEWTAPDAMGGTISEYRIRYADNETMTSPVVVDTGDTTLSREITGLSPGKTYWFEVAAINEAGVGAFSAKDSVAVGIGGKRFDGASFVGFTTAKRFDGSGWVDISIAKRFDGSVWVDISN